MAKPSQFKAYDLDRKNPHTIDAPPVKLHRHRFDKGKWAFSGRRGPAASTRATAAKVTKKQKRSKKAKPKKVPQSVIDVLRSKPEDGCEWCSDSPDCGIGCYRAFRKQCKENASKVDIRGPGQMGFGVYTKPDAAIAKGQYLDEYFGTIVPMPRTGRSFRSRYVFEYRDFCIDSEEAGNWTRYFNSACQPNVVALDTHIGGRYALVFQSSKNIAANEQLYIDYGRDYFVNAVIKCACSALRRPHVPKIKSQRKKGIQSGE